MTPAINTTMTSSERLITTSLSTLFAVRMLGLFILLPVLAVLGQELDHATPTLIGVAIGIYGLTQALLQIPFGLLSDRYGRRPLIMIGMGLFFIGSLVAANADTIYGIILGRALQGGGAVGGVITALLADQTRAQVRTKAMAMIGAGVGIAFLSAFILGPVLASKLGLSGLFAVIACLGALSLGIAWFYVPQQHIAPGRLQAETSANQLDSLGQKFMANLRQPQMARLYFSIGALHLVQTSLFVALPAILVHSHQMPLIDHWRVYVPIMLLAFAAIIPVILLAEKRGHLRSALLSMIGLMGIAITLMLLQYLSFGWLVISLLLFFAGFNALEALLPSLVSRLSPIATRGLCMSTYSTCQFFGAFLGGALGGLLYAHYGFEGLMLLNLVTLGLWLLVALGLFPPEHTKTIVVPVTITDHHTTMQLLEQLPGVHEVLIAEDNASAQLKIDRRRFQQQQLDDLLISFNASQPDGHSSLSK